MHIHIWNLFFFAKVRGNETHEYTHMLRYNYSTIIWLGAKQGWVQKIVYSTIIIIIIIILNTHEHDAESKINRLKNKKT